MYVHLGNLSINEFIERTGYNINDKDRAILESHRQDHAKVDINSDKFHIFDIPFNITVGKLFKDELIRILMKYENISPSKTELSVSEVTESEKEKEARIKREKEKQEWQDKLNNPNSIWNVKWHMLVPVKVNNIEIYYWCFINTYTTGRDNIPDIIDGTVTIRKDSEGFHGTFNLYNPESNDDANQHPDWKYVIGIGFMKKSGNYIGNIDDAYFEEIQFSIKEAIETYISMDRTSKEIHFDYIKDTK